MSGIAYDGYLSNCTVYLDVGNTGAFDPASDPHTVTSWAGTWTLKASSTDLASGANLRIVAGPAAGSACTDVTYNATLLLPLAAPHNSTVISPLTTLVLHVMGLPGAAAPGTMPVMEADAVLAVKVALGLNATLPPVLSPTSTDSIATAMAEAANSSSWQLQLLRAELQVATTVLQLASLMSPDSVSTPAVADLVFHALAQTVVSRAAMAMPLASAAGDSTSARRRLVQQAVDSPPLLLSDVGTLSDLLTTTVSLNLLAAPPQQTVSSPPPSFPNNAPFPPSPTTSLTLNYGVVMDAAILSAACTAVSNMQQV